MGYDSGSMTREDVFVTIDFRPVILAGGSGTRFWPRSRRARAKQVLALDGDRSMLQQTVERLHPIAGSDKVWVITNELLAAEIEAQLPGVPRGQIIEEPVARNTAPACGLAAATRAPGLSVDGYRQESRSWREQCACAASAV